MSTIVLAAESEPGNGEVAGRAMNAVAEGLAEQGFEVWSPAWEISDYLKIMNVRGTYCEVIIGENGSVHWEYRPFDRSEPDPAQITDMVLVILGADSAEYSGVAPRQYPGLTPKGVIGRALTERGMQVCLEVVDKDNFFYEIYAEIRVTNPARKDRGKVWFTDDSVVRWECRFSDPGRGIQGMELEEITDTITRVLADGRVRVSASRSSRPDPASSTRPDAGQPD